MYLELKNKFYEIVTRSNTAYIRYGKIPSLDAQLPFGRFISFVFPSVKDAKAFQAQTVSEKTGKGYITYKEKETHDMKWMRQNEQPKQTVKGAVNSKKSNKTKKSKPKKNKTKKPKPKKNKTKKQKTKKNKTKKSKN